MQVPTDRAKRRRFIRVAVLTLVLIVVLLFLAACGDTDTAAPVPQTEKNMRAESCRQAEQAMALGTSAGLTEENSNEFRELKVRYERMCTS